MPSVPVQLLLKFDPPMITIVYHFEEKEHDKYFHDILVEKRLLESLSEEDLTSHLYVTEAYYFNPKQIKRPQILRLVRKLKEGMLAKQQERRKNFFQRKRFVNYDQTQADEASEGEGNIAPGNKGGLVEFDEDPVIAGSRNSRSPPQHAPIQHSHSPQPVHPHHGPHHLGGVGIDGADMRRPGNKLPPLETGAKAVPFEPVRKSLPEEAQIPLKNQHIQQHQNSNAKSNGYDDLLEMQDFEEEQYEEHAVNPQQQFGEVPQAMVAPHFDGGADPAHGGFELGGEAAGEEEPEEESVYIKDNVVMRRIQIEGEDQEYLMDPEGNIYDMQGNFIGTANAQELEEMEEDGNTID